MATAVLDVGKTNVKVALFSADGTPLSERSRPNRSLQGPPYLHADVAGIWDFLVAALAELGRRAAIDTLVVTTHGAAGALTGDDPDRDDGLVLPVMDYEDPGPETIEPSYAALRPPFAETFSPPMAVGLNLGRQLAFQRQGFGPAFARARHFLTYPQYWAWRLSGVPVSEATSLGCHTDLWAPAAGRPSALVDRLGLAPLMPPLARAHDAIGRIRPEVAAATGLDPATRVLAGIHDSNASLVPHLLGRGPPFTVVSTGTWVVLMSLGADLARLDPAADMLANVDAAGRPVACAKFMGGREFAALTAGRSADAGLDDLAAVVAAGVLALPSFVPAGGPFAGRAGAVRGRLPERPGAAAALAALYCALVVDDLLGRLGADAGPLIVEGGFVRTAAFGAALAAVRPGQPVEVAGGTAGTAAGAALLARWPQRPEPERSVVSPPEIPGLARHRAAWRAAVGID